MNYRKSVIKKKFGIFRQNITKQDFISHTERFIFLFEKVCGPSEVTIEQYARIPHFCTKMPYDETVLDWQDRENKKGMNVLLHLSDLPDDFSQTPYVQITVRPQDKEGAPWAAFGTVTFGALLPSHIIFYAQPEEIAEVMQRELFMRNRPPKGFCFGDGFEDNAHVSLQ